MNDQPGKWMTALGRLGPWSRAGCLVSVILAVYAVAGTFAYWRDGRIGLIAATTAAAVCLIGALAALCAARFFSAPSYALHQLASGMLFRTGLPLAVGLVCHVAFKQLAAVGFLFYLLAFYLVMLAFETVLTLPAVTRPSAHSPKAT